jgi:hypothetical protein
LASLGYVTRGKRRGPGSESSGHVINDRREFRVRIAIAKVGHEAGGFPDAKVRPADEGLRVVSAPRIVRGPAADPLISNLGIGSPAAATV